MFVKLLKIDRQDFLRSKLHEELLDYVFNQGRFDFGPKMDEGLIKDIFGSRQDAIEGFSQYEPEIERVYFDLMNSKPRMLVVSFYNMDGKVQYGLIVYEPYEDKYEFIYAHWQFEKIDTSANDNKSLNEATNQKIIKRVLDEGLEALSPLEDSYFSTLEGVYYVDESKCSPELKEILITIIADKLGAKRASDIKIQDLKVDVRDLDNPRLIKVEFSYDDKIYEYSIETDELLDLDSFDYGDTESSYRDVFFEIAQKAFVDENKHVVKEKLAEKYKEEAKKLFVALFKRFTFEDHGDDTYGFKELGETPFITLKDDCVQIRTSRNVDIKDVETFKYESLSENKPLIKRTIDRYLLTKTKEYDQFLKDTEEFLNKSYGLEEAKSKAEELLERVSSFPSHDRENTLFKDLVSKIKVKHNKLLNLNKGKVARALELMDKIKDEASYDEYNEDLNDAIDELDEGELAAIKTDYDEFLERFGDIPKYPSNQAIYRRVFIRKSALDQLKRINIEQSNLKVLSIVDEIVDQLKTLPGNQLGRYLLNKGLNFPISADRSVKKIRIMRNAKYRLLFVYGSDLDVDDRLNNLDSIYIFAVTEHKKDKAELYRVAESKPTKYEINDFIIYPRNKIVKIPECTTEQYKIATSFDEKPVITFGCAGSGKTTVSIEQYVNIVYTKFNCESPSSSDLVYITFHKGLSDKVKKDLAEFKIEGNCYKLDEYFAYAIGETYDQTKIINEVKFINWFDKTYSGTEIKKNKGNKKARIAPLANKPDVARLLYTYYRGVFKGSKELLNTKDNYLTLETFLSEMSGETYLTDEEKNAIYQICKEFDGFARENGLLGDNDYALKVIRQAAYQLKRTGCIIIDEVQDLTEIEIIATIKTLKEDSKKIYFYGDPHQSINPNVFDSSTINRAYTALGKTTSSESAPLTITYRTNRYLIRYLNQLLEYRDRWIGLTKGGLSKIVEPPKTDEDTSWAGYVTNKSLYRRIFESNPNSMIITPSETVRRRLLEKWPDIEPARVITIYDAKGMEWDTIIMYNMFTDYESYFMDMISENGKAKKSTIHRMTFNKFYVGCTRSTKSFVIIEENEKIFDANNPIFEALLSSFAPIYKEEQVNTYILEDNTFDAWYKEALQNLDNDNPATFEHALMHAKRLAKTEEDMRLVKELLEGSPETLERYGFSYLEKGEYDLARSAFVKCYKKTKKHSAYILLTTVLSGRELSEDRLREFLKHQDVIEKYPEVLPNLLKQPALKARLKRLQTRLLSKEDE